MASFSNVLSFFLLLASRDEVTRLFNYGLGARD